MAGTSELLWRLLDKNSAGDVTASPVFFEQRLEICSMDTLLASGVRSVSGGTCSSSMKGIMCNHCEATVQRALEELDFISDAESDNEKGTVCVQFCGDPDEEAI